MCNLVKLFKTLIVTFLFIIGTVCIIGTGGSGGGGSDDDSGGDTGAPQTYIASGTYTYNPDTGELALNTTNSDFIGCGPTVGTDVEDVESITTSVMLLNQGEENEMTWTRDSGTAGDITGVWNLEQDGSTWEIKLNADLTFSVDAKIIACKTKWNVTFTIDLDGMDTNFLCIPGEFEGDDTREELIVIQQTGSTFTMETLGQTLKGTINDGVYTFSGSWIESDDDGDYTMNVNGSFAVEKSSGQVSGSDTIRGTNDAGNFCTWDETFIGIED